MRFLIEAKDSGNDKRAWTSHVGHYLSGAEGAMCAVEMEYAGSLNELEQKALETFFKGVWNQINAGMWGPGDHVMAFIDGCTFSVAAIRDTRH